MVIKLSSFFNYIGDGDYDYDDNDDDHLGFFHHHHHSGFFFSSIEKKDKLNPEKNILYIIIIKNQHQNKIEGHTSSSNLFFLYGLCV